eukprot:SAG31_NODE_17909_length_653_cov_4.027076_1_plen_111_part_00
MYYHAHEKVDSELMYVVLCQRKAVDDEGNLPVEQIWITGPAYQCKFYNRDGSRTEDGYLFPDHWFEECSLNVAYHRFNRDNLSRFDLIIERNGHTAPVNLIQAQSKYFLK